MSSLSYIIACQCVFRVIINSTLLGWLITPWFDTVASFPCFGSLVRDCVLIFKLFITCYCEFMQHKNTRSAFIH